MLFETMHSNKSPLPLESPPKEEITFREFDLNFDLGYVNTWMMDYGMKRIEVDDVPSTAFTAMMGIYRIACAFLRVMECNSGFFDGIVMNRACEIRLRDEVLDGLTNRILESAKNMGMKRVISFSNNKRILARANKFGCSIYETHFFLLKLEAK